MLSGFFYLSLSNFLATIEKKPLSSFLSPSNFLAAIEKKVSQRLFISAKLPRRGAP